MESVLKEYIKKIENLLNYVKKIQEINGLARKVYEEELAIKVQELIGEPSKRVLDYNLVIITLYGILEGFIEQIVKTYLDELSKSISKYEDFPEEIKKNHLLFSAELIKNCNKLSKYSHISEQNVITNLYNCIAVDRTHSLNVEAFTHHSSNFRKDTIREFFKNIGIENITCGICKNEIFRKYFYDYERLEEQDLEAYSEESFFQILDEIIERRNAIAHGSDVDDILSLAILENYIYYIKAIIVSIFGISNGNLNKEKFCNGNKIVLGKPLAVYNNSIVGLYSQNNKIEVGMLMYAKNSTNGEIRFGKIISMEHNRQKINSVDKENNLLLGIKVDFHAKKDWEYGFLEQP